MSHLHCQVLAASVSRTAGGIHESAMRLSQSLTNDGVSVRALGLEDEHSRTDVPQWSPVTAETVRPHGPRAFGYSLRMTALLQRNNADIVHCHGLWMYPSWACLQWADRTGQPYVVSPHGMLDPWALNRSRWKKRLSGMFFQNRHLANASCLHALCGPELQSLRSYGLRNPVCLLPNGVDVLDTASRGNGQREVGIASDRRVLLYVGRLHPKKGLSELITAWAQGCQRNLQLKSEWKLVIAGWSQGGHEAELRRQVRDLRVADSIHFVGPIFGEQKTAILNEADAMILPSRSEGLPMAVLEAWSHSLPVLMTPACNLPEGFQSAAALAVQPESASIMDGLIELVAMSDQNRREMGSRGRELVKRCFSWPTIAAEMHSVYNWILGGGAAPPCVQLN